jgi:hypothetical protein
MAQLVIDFAVSYIVGRLTEPKTPHTGNRAGFTADYGGPVPLIFGPEARTDQGTVIWSTPVIEHVHKHKPGKDYLFGVVGALLPKRKSYTYTISFAVLLAGNPIRRIRQILMNKKVVFDAGASTALVFTRTDGTHKLFNTLRVYQGTFSQTPDPTMEAEDGMGNVPAYLGSAYCVIDDLELETWGGSLPSEIEFVVEEAVECTLRRVVTTMADASGIDLASVSSGDLTRLVRGLIISTPASVSEAFTPLVQVYQFDVADQGGQLRFITRGRYPKTTVTEDQLAGHLSGEEQPERIRFQRQAETLQPREVTVNFIDPDRGYQPNSQSAHRSGGSAQSNIVVETGLTLSAADAKRAADEIMWEAWAGRQVASTTTDETRDDIQAAQVHAFQTPNGIDTFRVVRRSKGANNVIRLELRADRPLIYSDDVTGGAVAGGGGNTPAPAPLDPVTPSLPGVLNDPIFTEPPSSIAAAQVWISLSAELAGGGHDPNFSGVYVYVATADVDANYRNAGVADAAAYMGELTAPLPAYAIANPDTVNTLSVDLTESGGVLESVSAADAAAFVNLVTVQNADGSNAEFISFQDAAATGAFLYDATTLYRALYGTVGALHAAGSAFAVLDESTFRFSLPADMIGVPLWFKFVQVGQALADVPSWPYTPKGTGFGGGVNGVPTMPTGLNATPGIMSAILEWAASPVTDNVTSFNVYRAAGLGAAFGSAALVGTVTGLTWTNTGLAAATGYTYFLTAVNAVGESAPTAGEDVTTSTVDIIQQIYVPSTFYPEIFSNNQELLTHKFAENCTLPGNMAGSQFGATANATNSTVLTVQRAVAASPNVWTTIGTITIGAGGITPTFATTAGAAFTFAIGDEVRIMGPATADPTLSKPRVTLLMNRNT